MMVKAEAWMSAEEWEVRKLDALAELPAQAAHLDPVPPDGKKSKGGTVISWKRV